MRLIFAAYAFSRQYELLTILKHMLESYLAIKDNITRFQKDLDLLHEVDGSMLLDSGAFSAWTKGKTVDIDGFAKFCLTLQDHPAVQGIANLDVIPGAYGKIPDSDEVERSAKKGWENYQYLLSRGVRKDKLIHIYHQGEHETWLDLLVEEGGPYIGISPANDRKTDQKIMWLDRIMPKLIDNQGYPKKKFHGFAATALKLLQRYPWFSTDSTSWLRPGAYGKVLLPRIKDGEVLYNVEPTWVPFSDKSPTQKENGKHFNTLTQLEQETIRQFLEEAGTTPEILATDHIARQVVNIVTWQRIVEKLPEWPWPFKTRRTSFF